MCPSQLSIHRWSTRLAAQLLAKLASCCALSPAYVSFVSRCHLQRISGFTSAKQNGVHIKLPGVFRDRFRSNTGWESSPSMVSLYVFYLPLCIERIRPSSFSAL